MHDSVSDEMLDAGPDEVFAQRVELGDHVDQGDVEEHAGGDGKDPRVGVGVFSNRDADAEPEESGRGGEAIADQCLERKWGKDREIHVKVALDLSKPRRNKEMKTVQL